MKNYIDNNRERFIEELKSFLSIPSISADSHYKFHVQEAAHFIEQSLSNAGMDYVSKFYAGGNPIVYSEKKVDEDLPTVLIYGHYDVQPADPIDLWETPPFEPTIKKGKIYARGACDDKSQVFLIVKALEVINHFGDFSCNIKVIFEGEEETGSESLKYFVKKNKELLKADVLLVCDTSMPNENQPSLITSLRGVCYCEIDIIGVKNDLHSGMLGGAIINPIQVICNLISNLKDENNRIMIPGFYDHVLTPDLKEGDLDNLAFLKDYLVGEKGYSPYQLTTIRPSLDIHGIYGGYSDEGPKTVIPSKASAKLSIRLVEGQEHEIVFNQLQQYLLSMLPKQASMRFEKITGCNAVSVNTDTEAYRAASLALKNNFGALPYGIKIGGTIPVVSLIKQELNVETLLMGFGLDDDNIHAPNESFSINNFFKGINTLIDFFSIYSHIYLKTQKQLITAK